jgi:hypothetical protein
MTNAPDCRDFILTAIRETRPKLARMPAGAKSGVSVRRIWSLASNFYSEEEFREGLHRLHSTGVLLIIWNIGRGVEDRNWHVQHDEIMDEIPPKMPLDRDRWDKEANSSSIIAYADVLDVPVWRRDSICEVKLYIPDDGLPRKVSRLLAGETNKRALAVMAKCMEQN